MAIPMEVMIGVGTAAVAIGSAAAYSYFSGNEASVDYDDDGNDELTFGGDDDSRVTTAPSPYTNAAGSPDEDPREDADEEETGGLAETSESSDAPERVTEIGDNLTEINGIGEVRKEALNEAGFDTALDLWYASDAALTDVSGIGSQAVSQIRSDIGSFGSKSEGEDSTSDDEPDDSNDAA